MLKKLHAFTVKTLSRGVSMASTGGGGGGVETGDYGRFGPPVDLDPQFSKEKGGVGTRVRRSRTLVPTPPFSLIFTVTGR